MQKCKVVVYLRITSDDPFDSKHKSATDAEKILQHYQFKKVIEHKQMLAEIAEIIRVGEEISQSANYWQNAWEFQNHR